jgi:hypothetical protein
MWSSQHLHVTQGDILVPMGSSPLTHQPWLGLRSSLPIYALLSNSLSLPAHVSLSLSLSMELLPGDAPKYFLYYVCAYGLDCN